MHCEICGRPVEEPMAIEVDKAVLYVCRSCAASYGRRQVPQRQPSRGPQPRPQPRRPPAPRRELEVIEDFGEVVRRARENIGLSREVLAAMIGVKETVLRRIEAGQLTPDLELARKLERALGVKLLVEAPAEPSGGRSAGAEGGLTLGDVAEVRED